jgi:hypothetical protein
MRVITLEMPDSLEVAGHIPAFINVLSQARISILPVSSMKHDHILVKKPDLPRSVRLLRHFLQSCAE